MDTQFNFHDFIFLDTKLDVFIEIKHFKKQKDYNLLTNFLLEFIKNTINDKIPLKYSPFKLEAILAPI